MKSIFSYQDFQEYLKDFYKSKKNENSRFSYSVWSRKMNLKSSSMLSMVINNERLPSKAFIKKLATYFQLNAEEESYFQTLVNLKKLGKNPRLTIYLNSEEKKSNSVSKKSIFLSPISFIIKELLEIKPEIEINTDWLSKNILIKHEDYHLNLVLNELLENDVLEKNENGKLKVCEENLIKILASKEQIRSFHKANQEIAIQAFDTSEKDQRAFHTSFVKLKKDKLEEAKLLLKKFQRDFSTLVESGNGDSTLYQINLQMFPISKTLK